MSKRRTAIAREDFMAAEVCHKISAGCGARLEPFRFRRSVRLQADLTKVRLKPDTTSYTERETGLKPPRSGRNTNADAANPSLDGVGLHEREELHALPVDRG